MAGVTHGATRGYSITPEYSSWDCMIQRCTNPNNAMFSYYGGRGITVCDSWRNSFANFLADMGKRPSKSHSLDRYPNNNGNYEPSNCRWATKAEQQKGRRNARLITFRGRTETAHMWSKITGLPSRTIFNRLKAGWSPEKILTSKPQPTGFGVRNSKEVCHR